MIVRYEICKECNEICYAKRFQQSFNNWTSGNSDIDKFIQDTQLLAHSGFEKALEWIPYERFYDIKYIITKEEFGKVYRANWGDGSICYFDYENQNWKRGDQNMFVILKSLDDSKNITSEFMNKV